MRYKGGKSGGGAYQTIINLMPPHDVYIEPFLGGGAVMQRKRPATRSIGIDRSEQAVRAFIATCEDVIPHHRLKRDGDERVGGVVMNGDARLEVLCGDGIQFLRNYPFVGNELVYCDPPYMHETRSRCDSYRHEMSNADHRDLLDLIASLSCRIMISGYWTETYAKALAAWQSFSWTAMTRGGTTRVEWLWCNFAPPLALHDYRYLGESFRERERIKRKKKRWVSRLRGMPILERRALLAAMADAWDERPVGVMNAEARN